MKMNRNCHFLKTMLYMLMYLNNNNCCNFAAMSALAFLDEIKLYKLVDVDEFLSYVPQHQRWLLVEFGRLITSSTLPITSVLYR